MSNPNAWDPEWWKQDRDTSLGRKKAKAAAASGVSQGDTFLVVTEGEVTEPIYFELLLHRLELPQVTVKVMPAQHPILATSSRRLEPWQKSNRDALNEGY